MKPFKSLFNRYTLSIALLLAAACGYYFWDNSHAQDNQARYRTMVVERGDLTQLASANGTLNPVVLVNVGTQVSGTVKKWYADFNDHVKEGQKLLELDPALYNAQVKLSSASLAAARSQLKLAEANAARARELFRQEYISRQELDTSVQALEAARAQVAQVSAQLLKDNTNLGYSVIRSPVSGVVVSREVDIGQTVAASFQTPTLFKIAQDLSKMQIDSSFAEADVGNIKVDQPASFRVDAFPNRNFRGAVKQVRLNPTTQQNVVTYDVVIAVDNPDQVLMPGMTAYVNITVAQRQDVLTVPNAALRFRPADAAPRPDKPRAEKSPEGRKDGKGKGEGPSGTVYVLENGQPKAVRVSVGITDNRYTEVTGGEIKEGAAVIVEDRQPPTKAPGAPGMRLF
ncbi:MAG: efflux RND transporter periplasmic adaptor subunit [Sterolibacterium sp.]|nr:efflux RND transporter periplasmic adaptor subunit [Sterolibacterium sp.]